MKAALRCVTVEAKGITARQRARVAVCEFVFVCVERTMVWQEGRVGDKVDQKKVKLKISS